MDLRDLLNSDDDNDETPPPQATTRSRRTATRRRSGSGDSDDDDDDDDTSTSSRSGNTKSHSPSPSATDHHNSIKNKALKNKLAQRSFQQRQRLHQQQLEAQVHQLLLNCHQIPHHQHSQIIKDQLQNFQAFLNGKAALPVMPTPASVTIGGVNPQQVQPQPQQQQQQQQQPILYPQDISHTVDLSHLTSQERRKINNRLAQRASRDRKKRRTADLEAALVMLEGIYEGLVVAARGDTK
ncbi:hypothetical protein BDR26DRAFT_852575 [Obelidium mucronatum]|nr:hypothetical protein BDR26DRAFT_852575 [Obelidium mucronatum]